MDEHVGFLPQEGLDDPSEAESCSQFLNSGLEKMAHHSFLYTDTHTKTQSQEYRRGSWESQGKASSILSAQITKPSSAQRVKNKHMMLITVIKVFPVL